MPCAAEWSSYQQEVELRSGGRVQRLAHLIAAGTLWTDVAVHHCSLSTMCWLSGPGSWLFMQARHARPPDVPPPPPLPPAGQAAVQHTPQARSL